MQIKKDQVYDQLLKSAKEAFVSKGYDKASIRSIAKGAGTTLGNLYNYFESKEHLLHRLLQELEEKMKGFIKAGDGEVDDMEAFMTRFSFLYEDDFLLLFLEVPVAKKMKQMVEAVLMGHLLEDHMEKEEALAGILTHSFMEGLKRIIQLYPELSARRKLVISLIVFYGKGLGEHIDFS